MSGELFVALRCEEIPASMVRPALKGLADGLLGLIDGVEHGAVRTWATPRRLAVAIADVAPARPTTEAVVTGPPADRAFDADGNPTPAGAGFARGKGADPADLRIVELPKRGKVAALTVREGGESVVALVQQGLAGLIEGIPFAKSMVWGEGGLSFGRPLHGIVALYDGAGVEVSAHGLDAGTTTIGHRLDATPFSVDSADAWVDGLRAHHVEPDLDVRADRIRAILVEAATELGADPIDEPALVEEVLHLVEWPVGVLGAFDADLLELPPRLLITSMKVHQRYFPVHRDGALTHHFVVVSNNPYGEADVIAEGNARVLRARFYDARFFYAEDRSVGLDSFAARLVRTRWIRGLGTLADKSVRIERLARELSDWTGADPDVASRAGSLSKADLSSQMVGEFPELQGHMGRWYALAQGDDDAVAVAIEEHYLPRHAGDAIAQSPAGVSLALADRLDTLVGCFGVGMEPKGGDPQGLRRAALGLVRIILGHDLRGSVRDRLAEALRTFHDAASGDDFKAWTKARGTDAAPTDADALLDRLTAFVLARFKAARVADGVSPDVVDAVLGPAGAQADLVVLDRTVSALAERVGTPEFPALLQTLKRVLNIGGESSADAVDGDLLSGEVERSLLASVRQADADVRAAQADLDVGAALDAVLGLGAPVEAFFEGVLVHADDPDVRALRLALLGEVAAVFLRIADFSRISTT